MQATIDGSMKHQPLKQSKTTFRPHAPKEDFKLPEDGLEIASDGFLRSKDQNDSNLVQEAYNYLHPVTKAYVANALNDGSIRVWYNPKSGTMELRNLKGVTMMGLKISDKDTVNSAQATHVKRLIETRSILTHIAQKNRQLEETGAFGEDVLDIQARGYQGAEKTPSSAYDRAMDEIRRQTSAIFEAPSSTETGETAAKRKADVDKLKRDMGSSLSKADKIAYEKRQAEMKRQAELKKQRDREAAERVVNRHRPENQKGFVMHKPITVLDKNGHVVQGAKASYYEVPKDAYAPNVTKSKSVYKEETGAVSEKEFQGNVAKLNTQFYADQPRVSNTATAEQLRNVRTVASQPTQPTTTLPEKPRVQVQRSLSGFYAEQKAKAEAEAKAKEDAAKKALQMQKKGEVFEFVDKPGVIKSTVSKVTNAISSLFKPATPQPTILKQQPVAPVYKDIAKDRKTILDGIMASNKRLSELQEELKAIKDSEAKTGGFFGKMKSLFTADNSVTAQKKARIQMEMERENARLAQLRASLR